MPNLDIYNKVKTVPKEAQKPINGGRLKGMTDINPMWRIKVLTETFGVVGFGWRYEITKQWIEQGGIVEGIQEISAFVNINLYVKQNNEWSEAIPGTGGSSFVTKEGKPAKAYTNDECFKMALTDALSVACKALGVAAEVYFAKDRTKYDVQETKPESILPTQPLNSQPPNTSPQLTGASAIQELEKPQKITKEQGLQLYEATNKDVNLLQSILKTYSYNKTGDVNACDFENILTSIKLNKLVKGG